LGKANIVVAAEKSKIDNGESCCVITYGMGVYWAKTAAKKFPGRVEIIDLRSLFPLDEELIFERVKQHGKCLVLTEEQQNNSFAEALAGRISKTCFQWLDGPVEVLGSANVPAIPLNMGLEAAILPNADKTAEMIQKLFSY
jgi:2-oxoisovalerate dehydrogenase E1 component